MAVSNTLVRGAARPSDEVAFTVHGETVTLSPEIIKKYLVSGDPSKVTEQELTMFLNMCKFQHLNPFLREAYLIKYGNSPATMVTGKDVFVRRARASVDFDGYQAGVIVFNKNTGEVTEREGGWWMSSEETLLGGWAKVRIKGIATPFYSAVSFNEYAGRDKEGNLNKQWREKPCTMIRKVALSQALREAFPDQNSGMYSPEEIAEATFMELDDNPVSVPTRAEAQRPAIEKKAEPVAATAWNAVQGQTTGQTAEAVSDEDAAMAALFG